VQEITRDLIALEIKKNATPNVGKCTIIYNNVNIICNDKDLANKSEKAEEVI
jgi:hypothetical protein